MKRGIIALAVGTVVFTAVFASAASLTVNGGSLQAGGDDTLTCDKDGVTAAYALVWNAATGVYDVDQVTVAGIDAACAGLPLEVDLADGKGASLSHVATTVQKDGGSQLIDVPNTSAVDVLGAHVAIHS